jgi:hypothetical protein
MGFLSWFPRRKVDQGSLPLSQGAVDFLEGGKNTLTSADIDPESAEKYARYERAMALKKSGKLSEAADLFIKSCSPPSIYKGHYRELFKIWRQFNRDDLHANRYQQVIDRVSTMIRLDQEMIKEMLRFWGIQQKRCLPSDYFDNDRNLTVTDAKVMKKAAEALGQDDNVRIATELLQNIAKKKV